ncbi:MAG: hypothetical protein RI947_9 [Candidatus Parcubacteria bacterium]|jgi:gas vesicle protein
MKNQNNHTPSNFWFGFAVGTFGAVAAAYLMGTKQGRETLKKLIQYADRMEEGSDEFLDLMDSLKQVVKQKSSDIVDSIEGATEQSKSNRTLDSLIEKVKSITRDGGHKEIFVKK